MCEGLKPFKKKINLSLSKLKLKGNNLIHKHNKGYTGHTVS